MAKTKKKTESYDAQASAQLKAKADDFLKAALGKFEDVVVVGLNANNQLDLSTNIPSYVFLQYVLNRASFELLIHEKSEMQAKADVAVS